MSSHVKSSQTNDPARLSKEERHGGINDEMKNKHDARYVK